MASASDPTTAAQPDGVLRQGRNAGYPARVTGKQADAPGTLSRFRNELLPARSGECMIAPVGEGLPGRALGIWGTR
jgi:hypothetical protein